jgi:hypothetical protein
MTEFLDVAVSILTLLTLALGLYFAIHRFGLKRERFTFADLTLNTTVLKSVESLLLVSISVLIKNKGQTRISARRHQDINIKDSDFLYDDRWDRCKHAGTLKIRQVEDKNQAELFDWYSLKPIKNVRILEGDDEYTDGDFEQINYLYDFQDPKIQYKDNDFWLEPNETYEAQIMIWLPPGTYAMKAYFLGKMIKYQEEEYWSSTNLFDLRANKESH